MSNELFLKRSVSSGSVSLFLSLCLAICLFLFCFVRLFSKAVFHANCGFSVLSFYHFEGSFHFWAILRGLVLRPFSTCSSLMAFSPFSRFLWLLSLLVASSFCSLLSRVLQGSFLPTVCDFFVFYFLFVFCFVFSWGGGGEVVLFCFLLGRLPPSSFLTGSVLISLLSLDPFTV